MPFIDKRYRFRTTVALVGVLTVIGIILLLRFSGLLFQPLSNQVSQITPGSGDIPALALSRLPNGNFRLEALDNHTGYTVQTLTPSDVNVVAYRWAPSREFIVYSTQAIPGNPSEIPPIQLWRVDANGLDRTELAQLQEPQALFSVNSASTQIAVTTPSKLLLIDVTQAEAVQELLLFPAVGLSRDTEGEYVPEPTWSADGKLIIKLRDAKYLQNYQTTTYKIDPETRTSTVLAKGQDITY